MTPITIYMGVGVAWAFSILVLIFMPQFPDAETRKVRTLFAESPILSLTVLFVVSIFFWPILFLADLKKGFSR